MILGLTGGIASGKSTVAKMMKDRGIPVIDADEISRAVVAPGEGALERIKETFGEEVIHEDGTLNRGKLGEMVFADVEKRETLNHIVHPAVRTRIKEQAQAKFAEGYTLIVMDIPLLVENNLFYLVDETIVVYTSQDIQKKRLMQRNEYSETEAQRRIASQMPLEEKRRYADHVIDNSRSIRETEEQVIQLLEAYIEA